MQVHEQLRQAREASGLDLSALEDRTRVRFHLLEAVEAGRFADLPRGVYARAVLRSYAGAVGLDPEMVVAQVAPMLPGLEDPLDGLARVHGLHREPGPGAGRTGGEQRAGGRETANAPNPPLALNLAAVVQSVVATLADSAVLALIFAAVTGLTAGVCGVSVAVLIRLAAPALCILCALVAGLYFLLLGGVLGVTPGTRLARVLPGTGPRVVTAWTALHRGLELAVREVSIVVDLVIARRNAA